MSNDPFPVYEKCCVVCVKERERFILKLGLMSLGVLCVQRYRAGKQAGDSGKD